MSGWHTPEHISGELAPLPAEAETPADQLGTNRPEDSNPFEGVFRPLALRFDEDGDVPYTPDNPWLGAFRPLELQLGLDAPPDGHVDGEGPRTPPDTERDMDSELQCAMCQETETGPQPPQRAGTGDDEAQCAICQELMTDDGTFQWPGCHGTHRFHALCVAQHRPLRQGLAHHRRTGESARICEASCPLCRRIWGDMPAADAFLRLLARLGFQGPYGGCPCPPCFQAGAGPESDDEIDVRFLFDAMPDEPDAAPPVPERAARWPEPNGAAAIGQLAGALARMPRGDWHGLVAQQRWSTVVVPWLWCAADAESPGTFIHTLCEMATFLPSASTMLNENAAGLLQTAFADTAYALRRLQVTSARGLSQYVADSWPALCAWTQQDSRFHQLDVPGVPPWIPPLGYIPDFVQEYLLYVIVEALTQAGRAINIIRLPDALAAVTLAMAGDQLGQLSVIPGETHAPVPPPPDRTVAEDPPPPAAEVTVPDPTGDSEAPEPAGAHPLWGRGRAPAEEDGMQHDMGLGPEDDAARHGDDGDRMHPRMPPPLQTAADNGWEAIDVIPIMTCFASPFAHLDAVPHEHSEAWAHAVVDVLTLHGEAEDEEQETRALKWFLVLHDVLLRMPPRGGRRGRAQVAHRFNAWAAGDMATIIKWWQQDRAAARHPLSGEADAERNLQRALRLIREGELSRATRLLHTTGLGDLTDARVLEQLQHKHPHRKADVPRNLADMGQFARIEVDLAPTLRELPRHAGTGVSGFRNEYLTALTEEFADDRARSAVPLLNTFAGAYANAELPAWFYFVHASTKLMAPIKQAAPTPDEAPDVRPIGAGECLGRAIHRSVITDFKPALANHLFPQQVAIGVEGGISKLVFAIRLLAESNPDWVVVKIDLRNAFNEIARATVLARLNADPALRSLVPMVWAVSSPASPVFLAACDLAQAPFRSEEGMRQGDAAASAAFCVGIHPEVRALDAELAASGGAARFDMDDGYAVGHPDVVFPAILAFAERVAHLGLELQLHKCTYYSVAGDMSVHPARPPNLDPGSIQLQSGAVGYGLDVAGVPVGDDIYVAATLDCRAEESVSKIQTITSQLRDHHLQSLHAVIVYCLAPAFHYWIQHCDPRLTAAAAQRVDQALATAATICYGPGVASDPFAARRLRLPARKYGGGLRRLVDVAPAAFVGTLCRTVPTFTDSVDAQGGLRQGFLPALASVLGARSFDAGGEACRFDVFLASGSPLAHALLTQWAALQHEVGGRAEGPLLEPVRAAGANVSKLQRAITEQRERVQFQALDVELRALPAEDMRRAAWVNLDRFSTVWVTSLPCNDAFLTNAEFMEIATFYYGLPSPACAGVLGQTIAATRHTVDLHGNRLTTLTLPGDGWRTQHDAIKWRIHEDAKEMQARSRTEVYGLFAARIPQEGRSRANAQPTRKRQGLVPDLMITVPVEGPERAILFEIKTLHFGNSTYPPSTERCGAVARRARALPAEYAAKAREIDRKFCGTLPADVGPVEQHLRSFDPVRGLVFGAWGEASPDVEKLLTALAHIGATRHWRGMRCRDAGAAVGVLAWMLRRRWALTVLRENARLKLERLEFVGRGAAAAATRRVAGRAAHAARARTTAVFLARGPRGTGRLDG